MAGRKAAAPPGPGHLQVQLAQGEVQLALIEAVGLFPLAHLQEALFPSLHGPVQQLLQQVGEGRPHAPLHALAHLVHQPLQPLLAGPCLLALPRHSSHLHPSTAHSIHNFRDTPRATGRGGWWSAPSPGWGLSPAGGAVGAERPYLSPLLALGLHPNPLEAHFGMNSSHRKCSMGCRVALLTRTWTEALTLTCNPTRITNGNKKLAASLLLSLHPLPRSAPATVT